MTAIKRFAWIAAMMLAATAVHAQPAPRLTAFISDVHLGLGRTADGNWHPYEDFRWPNALRGFLDALSAEGGDRVDLVVVGDFLELWQLPDDIACKGAGPGAGCSVPELVDLVGRITRAHAAELAALRAFSVRGDNRLYFVPGNHDAALLIPEVWAPVFTALGGASGRVVLERSGIWRSADKRVLAEHGHQIGIDVNRFETWPDVTTTGNNGERLMIRPWGEQFVQKLFNAEEARYPIIDNLNPESAGARYRMAERGFAGSASDLARFVAFNIFETSFGQKITALEPAAPPGAGAAPPTYDRKTAVDAGAQLFISSLPPDDPFRKMLTGDDASAKEARTALNELAKTLSDEELQMLCQNALLVEQRNLCAPALLAAATGALVPRQAVFTVHVAERMRTQGTFEIFIYAHTHRWERGWDVTVPGHAAVTIFNTGAFQRLVDEEGFLQRARDRHWSTSEALRRLQVEDLAPCYGVVVVKASGAKLDATLRMWQMPEAGPGQFREPGVSDCR